VISAVDLDSIVVLCRFQTRSYGGAMELSLISKPSQLLQKQPCMPVIPFILLFAISWLVVTGAAHSWSTILTCSKRISMYKHSIKINA
jgi:hypothetical protein